MPRYRPSLPPLGAFVVFEAAARLKSFARAAEELSVTQPAVSKRIRELESQVETQLFERERRGVRLTQAGQALYSRTSAALDYLDEACANLRTPRTKPLAIAALTPVAHFWLNPLLGTLHPGIPQAPLRIVASDDTRDLNAEDNDLVILLSRGERIGWRLHHLFDEEVMPVASPEYITRHGLKTDCSLEEQARTAEGLTLLNHERLDPERINWHSWARQFDPNLLARNHVVEFNSFTLAVSSALAGEGVVIASEPIMRSLVESSQLQPLCRDRWKPETAYYLAHREERPPAGHVRLLMDYLLEQATLR